MSDIIRTKQVVPPDFAELLQRTRQENSARFSALCAAAVTNGWTLTALGEAVGVTREAIRLRVKCAQVTPDLPAIPLPPCRRNPLPAPVRRLELPAEEIARLRAMAAVARTVVGQTPPDHPSRRVSEDLSAQLAAYAKQGFSLQRLSAYLGLSPEAVRHRLGRHGYRRPCPSKASQVYRSGRIGGAVA